MKLVIRSLQANLFTSTSRRTFTNAQSILFNHLIKELCIFYGLDNGNTLLRILISLLSPVRIQFLYRRIVQFLMNFLKFTLSLDD